MIHWRKKCLNCGADLLYFHFLSILVQRQFSFSVSFCCSCSILNSLDTLLSKVDISKVPTGPLGTTPDLLVDVADFEPASDPQAVPEFGFYATATADILPAGTPGNELTEWYYTRSNNTLPQTAAESPSASRRETVSVSLLASNFDRSSGRTRVRMAVFRVSAFFPKANASKHWSTAVNSLVVTVKFGGGQTKSGQPLRSPIKLSFSPKEVMSFWRN